MTTVAPTIDPLDRLLALADLPQGETPELPPIVLDAAKKAGSAAYYDARRAGHSREQATAAAAAAFTKAAELGLATARALPAAPTPDGSDAGRGTKVDEAGRLRHEAGFAAAVAAGFAPARPLYAPGTKVAALGVDNARRSRIEHDAKPLVSEACAAFVRKIEAENREIVEVPAHTIGMHEDGRLDANGTCYPIEERALVGLASRLGYGGGQYLAKCPPVLRAHNVNAWRDNITAAHDERVAAEVAAGEAPSPPRVIALRTRNGDGPRSVFAAVGPKYTPFDCDLVAKAIGLAAPKDARGAITYDGAKARFECMFHSDVRPEHYVAGEFFKAGVIVKTDDTGGGAVVVSACVWQNLCLNLIILDKANRVLARIFHVGDLDRLVERFKRAFAKALASIEHFTTAWGYACKEDVVHRTGKATGGALPTDLHEQLAGIFNGIMAAGLVKVPGRRKDNVDRLIATHDWDQSGAKLVHQVSRASIVNAFTRFAHTELDDPWAQDEIERNAGALLYAVRGDGEPAPLPFLDPETAENGETPVPTTVH